MYLCDAVGYDLDCYWIRPSCESSTITIGTVLIYAYPNE